MNTAEQQPYVCIEYLPINLQCCWTFFSRLEVFSARAIQGPPPNPGRPRPAGNAWRSATPQQPAERLLPIDNNYQTASPQLLESVRKIQQSLPIRRRTRDVKNVVFIILKISVLDCFSFPISPCPVLCTPRPSQCMVYHAQERGQWRCKN